MSKTFENKHELGTALMDASRFANQNTDGHFTLMKFTTNWRASFFTPNDREETQLMSEAPTAHEAVEIAIQTFTFHKGSKEHKDESTTV